MNMKDFPLQILIRILISILIYQSLITLFKIGENETKENINYKLNKNKIELNITSNNDSSIEITNDTNKEKEIFSAEVKTFELKNPNATSTNKDKNKDLYFSTYNKKRINLILFLITISSIIFLFIIHLDKKRTKELKYFDGEIKYQRF